MRVGIYVETAKGDRPTGIGRHVLNLLSALAQVDDQTEYLLYYASKLRGEPPFQHGPPQANFRARPVRVPGNWQWNRPRLWWDLWLPRVLRRDRIDVFHGPNHFLPKAGPWAGIVTIHDMAYFHMAVHEPGMDELMRQWTQRAVDGADAVIALSQNTSRDVVKLGVREERVRVIYGGGHVTPDERIAFHRTDELRTALGIPGPFILYVGALQPRKNVPFLVRAFARLKQAGDWPHKLVLAGPPEAATRAEVESLAVELGVADDVIVTGYLDDWQIPLLYKLADVFVLPTRYEGFTLVTLEAMAYGVPVVATDTSSIREGVGDAALLVGEDDVPALADAITRASRDGQLRGTLIGRGREQAAKFTWRRCAEQTRDLYQQVSQNRVSQKHAGQEQGMGGQPALARAGSR
jgi:glycosyltransferase involved in cell wall biosynthesis